MSKTFLISVLSLFGVWAQRTVVERSGARANEASVTMRQLDTGLVPKVRGASGCYWIGMLPVGRYELNIAAQGFATFRQTPIALEVSQVARMLRLWILRAMQGVTQLRRGRFPLCRLERCSGWKCSFLSSGARRIHRGGE